MVEGRPLPGGNGVVLAQPAAHRHRPAVWRTLWLPLLAGLRRGRRRPAALLARRLARPIRDAADRRGPAARRRPHGAGAGRAAGRGRRIWRTPSTSLAAALATSEGRQREFLLSVSHELRTPLTTIRGYAEALADGVVAADGAQRAGQTMLAEAEHLDRLVSDLLALARLEAADFAVELVRGRPRPGWSPTPPRRGARGCAAAGALLRTELPDGPVPALHRPGPAAAGARRAAGERAAGGAGRRAVVLAVRAEAAGGGRRGPRRRAGLHRRRPGRGVRARRAVRALPGRPQGRQRRWAWRWPPGWSAGSAAGSRPATPPRAAPGSPSAAVPLPYQTRTSA